LRGGVHAGRGERGRGTGEHRWTDLVAAAAQLEGVTVDRKAISMTIPFAQLVRQQPAPQRTRRPLTILIVEDDPAIGDMLGEVVAEVPGWRAAIARNAKEALAVLRRVTADVFLFDVNLPGPSGPELLAWLKGEPDKAGVPAVLMSAAGRGPQVVAALQRGEAMAFLQKPFDLDELLAVLHRAVQSIPVAGRAVTAGPPGGGPGAGASRAA
jgi:CheY-like chemotaxis protein